MVTFEKLLKIIQDTAKTDYQKAADLHSLLNESTSASAPAPREQKKRGPKPKPKVAEVPNGEVAGGMFGGEPPA